MTVNDILEKVYKIDRLYDKYEDHHLDDSDLNESMELLMEYKEELLAKKIVK